MISVQFHRGVHLPGHALWLDPHERQPLAFVSHAHSDHLAPHEAVILSSGTAALMRERLRGERIETELAFGQPHPIEGGEITLLPAGHIFGSAQAWIESSAGTLLYTGDFKLRPGLSAERTEWRGAETLIMETTYGLPRYTMPPSAETLAMMVDFCRDALDDGAVPVLLGYSLGKAQEILCALDAAGLPPMLHPSVHRLTEIYRRLRPDFPGRYELFAPEHTAGSVLICPPSANRTRMLTGLKNRRVAVLTGWALDPATIHRYQCDAAFPLTDHADYPDLIRYVELVRPRRVLTLHGFAVEFARDLRERGIEAWALTGHNQLEFTLGTRPAATAKNATPAEAAPRQPPAGSFLELALVADRIGAENRKLAKVRALAGYLRALEPNRLPIAVNLLAARPAAARPLQAGWAVIKRALASASRRPESEVREVSRENAEPGRTAYQLLLGRTVPRPWPLEAIAQHFSQLATARGPLAKIALLCSALESMAPSEASLLVRVLTGDLRIGLKEGLIEEAIATAFDLPPEAIREAAMLTGELSEAALLAAENRLDSAGVRLFRPVKVMLASPEPTAMAAWSRMAGCPAWAEEKFDGIRAQIHAGEGRVELFTRDLRPITSQFTDLARIAATLPRRVILDGEIIAFDPEKKLTFADLQKRLGRTVEDDLFLGGGIVPVVFRAFDLLWFDGESLLRQPLDHRRHLVEALPFPPGLEIALRLYPQSPADLADLFRQVRARGGEGLIIKRADSLYTPGRRGLSWIKLKQEWATLDVVVTGAEQGHGKRAHVLSDYTFAVRDEASGALLTIGKAYTGLTDAEIEELTEHFKNTTISIRDRFREVHPEIVLEIAFDRIQPSTRHPSGLALRFPRIKAIRRDKTPADIDTLAHARSLVAAAAAAPW
jgi:DNA ligase-1